MDLYGKPEGDTVRLGQVLLEGLKTAPNVEDLRMVRSQQPIDDPEAFEPPIRPAGIAIREQRCVSLLLKIDCHLRRHQWNDIEMGDVEYRSAR